MFLFYDISVGGAHKFGIYGNHCLFQVFLGRPIFFGFSSFLPWFSCIILLRLTTCSSFVPSPLSLLLGFASSFSFFALLRRSLGSIGSSLVIGAYSDLGHLPICVDLIGSYRIPQKGKTLLKL